jgi:hypothetical protein
MGVMSCCSDVVAISSGSIKILAMVMALAVELKLITAGEMVRMVLIIVMVE